MKKNEAGKPALLYLMPLGLIYISRLISEGDAAKALVWIIEKFPAALVEYLIIAAVMSLLYGIFGRHWVPWLVGIVVPLVAAVSYFKLQINGSPLILGDFALAGQLPEIVSFAAPQMTVPWSMIIAAIAYGAVLLFLLIFGGLFATLDIKRIIYAAVGIAGIFLLLTPVGPVLSHFAGGKYDSAEERAVAIGAEMGIYYSWQESRTPIDLSGLEGIRLSGAEELKPGEKPTVIFLMSEAFFDPTGLPNVKFEKDPVPEFRALQAESRHGKFRSMTFAGGTGYVELEVLTGLCDHMLREPDRITDLPAEKYSEIPCIADIFEAQGYKTTFLHSYNSSLYNRETIYKGFGFDEVLFEDAFSASVQRKGDRISDMALTEKIIELADRDGEPRMIFAVSMENHQPYSPGKFGELNDIALTAQGLTSEELETIRTYAYGARDASAALGALCEHYRNSDKKVMIVFWGDHLPSMYTSGGKSIFKAVGAISTDGTTNWTTQELHDMLSTDYIIWKNYHKDSTEIEESSLLLGLHAASLAGQPLTDWFSWLRDNVAPSCILYRSRLFVDGKGNSYSEIPESAKKAMDDYRKVLNDIIYGENKLFKRYREAA